jgi:hypothetical protein
MKTNDKNLTLLADYDETQAQLERYRRLGGWKTENQYHDRYEAEVRKLSQFTIPDQPAMVTACEEELKRLATEAHQLSVELRHACQGELEARLVWSAAQIRLDYAELYGLLGIDRQAALQDVRKAQAAFDAASAKCHAVRQALSNLSYFVGEAYPGTELSQPATFEAAALGRVERVLGPHYERQEQQDALNRLGIKNPMALFS